MRQNEELEKIKEEVKVKTAQVTQFKKQLEGKNNTIQTEQVEKVSLFFMHDVLLSFLCVYAAPN